ncbi:citrate synthase [Planctomicrobium piriforme]|uniref:Citrate synthase n=1 Tax=Planctomicrobium piriforme TaxID=1576369 RepID=A0A1I3DAN9_9PLAN|nr:citrate synthase [Planctomicrobium piriforme]SFH83561.1 citrate synthase [Planctomicrobium piriforme]
MPNTLTITDNRTGRTYEIPVQEDTVKAIDLRQIKVEEGDFGLMAYDPGYTNTASCKSRITYIDGDVGILEYRGYPIEVLAEKCTYLEVAYLLLNGELPDAAQLKEWDDSIRFHTVVHENIKRQMESFRYDAHPMGMLISTVAAMSTFYPEAKKVGSPENRAVQIKRLIAKVPTIAAFSYRHSQGHPYVYPNNDLSYTENFLAMMFQMFNNGYKPDPALVRALEVLFILHADHEQNCSTSVMRAIGSSDADPYSAHAGAAAALYGPLHGGANEAVLRMLAEIGSVKEVPKYVARCKSGEMRLMGFGHRVYKNYDPRARIIKKCAEEVFDVTGRNPLLDVALELERIALEDEYFVKRKLYPNVDFYSGLIYEAMGLPVTMFPVLFAIPRTAGWLAQWKESMEDEEQRIQRPRQIYLGERTRDFVPLEKRPAAPKA